MSCALVLLILLHCCWFGGLMTSQQAMSWPNHWPPLPMPLPPFKGGYPHPPQPPQRGEDLYPGTFLGEGSVNLQHGAAELSCNLDTGDGYIVSNVVWSKMQGQGGGDSFDCGPKCRGGGGYWQMPPYEEGRIQSYSHLGKSILIVHDIRPYDMGLYRCSATAKTHHSQIYTVYQVVHF